MTDRHYVAIRTSTDTSLPMLLTDSSPDYQAIQDQLAKVLEKHENYGPETAILEVPADIGKLLIVMAHVISEWKKLPPQFVYSMKLFKSVTTELCQSGG